MTVEPEGRQAQRFAWLDLLRFLCAMAVVLFHYGYVAPLDLSGGLADYVVAPTITIYGRLGVPVFFMVSGFVIAISAEGRTWRDFLWARMVRLYPAYWLAVPATALVLAMTASPRAPGLGQTLVNLTMLQAFVGVPHVDEVYHTLAVELRFYLLVALLVMARVRVTSPAVLIGWIITSAAAPWLPGIMGKLLLTNFAPYFLTGMTIRAMLRPQGRLLNAALLVVLLAMEAWMLGVGGAARPGPYDPAVQFAIVVAGTVLILVCAFAPNPRRAAPLAALGAMTYPLYLFHSEIGMALMRVAAPWMPRATGIWPMVGAMLLLAWLVSRYPEPAIRHRLQALPRRRSGARHGLEPAGRL
ncbi:acyltransferase family protein [Sphingomonas sp. R86520]|uniref:acyltransferase family protein n=1 Tax=Sphingomonas sp. R86520 TaxID=3093859 RepID=UPI0036D3D134